MAGTVYITILGMAAATFFSRVLPFLILRNNEIPQRVSNTLRFIPIAVLSTLILPELFIREGALFLSFSNYYLLAGLVTIFIAYKTQNMLITVVGGMVTMLLLRMLLA